MASMVEEAGSDATERVLERVAKTESNEEFFQTLKTEQI